MTQFGGGATTATLSGNEVGPFPRKATAVASWIVLKL